jgi:hypothetical protein
MRLDPYAPATRRSRIADQLTGPVRVRCTYRRLRERGHLLEAGVLALNDLPQFNRISIILNLDFVLMPLTRLKPSEGRENLFLSFLDAIHDKSPAGTS